MKTRIAAILSIVFSVFILSGIFFASFALMLNLDFREFINYSTRDQFLVVAAPLFPLLGGFGSAATALYMHFFLENIYEEENLRTLVFPAFWSFPVILLFVILAFLYNWVNVFSIIACSFGFYLLVRSVVVAVRVEPREEVIVEEEVEVEEDATQALPPTQTTNPQAPTIPANAAR